jgi:hypothetical protein
MAEGDRPGGAPNSGTKPTDAPPRADSSLDDPAKLTRAGRMIQIALARQGLTIADLRPPVEHVRAA